MRSCLGVYVIFVHFDKSIEEQVGVHRRDHQPADDGTEAARNR